MPTFTSPRLFFLKRVLPIVLGVAVSIRAVSGTSRVDDFANIASPISYPSSTLLVPTVIDVRRILFPA